MCVLRGARGWGVPRVGQGAKASSCSYCGPTVQREGVGHRCEFASVRVAQTMPLIELFAHELNLGAGDSSLGMSV